MVAFNSDKLATLSDKFSFTEEVKKIPFAPSMALLSMAAYILGYIKYYYLIDAFRVSMSPISIFPAISIFFSGGATIAAALVSPIVFTSAGFIVAKWLDRDNGWLKGTRKVEIKLYLLFSLLSGTALLVHIFIKIVFYVALSACVLSYVVICLFSAYKDDISEKFRAKFRPLDDCEDFSAMVISFLLTGLIFLYLSSSLMLPMAKRIQGSTL